MCGTFGCLLERGQERARDRLVEFMSRLARNHDCEAERSTSQPVRLTTACLHLNKIHRYKYRMFVLPEDAYSAPVSSRDQKRGICDCGPGYCDVRLSIFFASYGICRSYAVTDSNMLPRQKLSQTLQMNLPD